MTAGIRDRFLADHRRLEGLLDGVLAACSEKKDGSEASRLWRELDADVRTHFDAEEAHLIPALPGLHERVRVLVQEHRYLRARLAELGIGFDSHTVRLDSVRNFIAELHAHAQSEDQLLYQWADAHLDEPAQRPLIDALVRKPTA